jgi:hypothetical protein
MPASRRCGRAVQRGRSVVTARLACLEAVSQVIKLVVVCYSRANAMPTARGNIANLSACLILCRQRAVTSRTYQRGYGRARARARPARSRRSLSPLAARACRSLSPLAVRFSIAAAASSQYAASRRNLSPRAEPHVLESELHSKQRGPPCGAARHDGDVLDGQRAVIHHQLIVSSFTDTIPVDTPSASLQERLPERSSLRPAAAAGCPCFEQADDLST